MQSSRNLILSIESSTMKRNKKIMKMERKKRSLIWRMQSDICRTTRRSEKKKASTLKQRWQKKEFRS